MNLESLIRELVDSGGDSALGLTEERDFIGFLKVHLYDQFEPTAFEGGGFYERLGKWLGNTESAKEARRFLFLISKIFFVGREEFKTLYRCALNEILIPWIMDVEKVGVEDPRLMQKVQQGLDSTWFCPITDSMRINSFIHVNRLRGFEFRPDWRSIRKFGDMNIVKEFVDRENIKRIVLLEDFVGTGTQAKKSISHIADNFPDLDIMVIPLVCCSEGEGVLLEEAGKKDNVSVRPVICIPASEIVSSIENENDLEHVGELRALSDQYSSLLELPFQSVKDLGMLGFRNTGANVVLFSNCPNNTLAIMHYDGSDSWEPLFPRNSRSNK